MFNIICFLTISAQIDNIQKDLVILVRGNIKERTKNGYVVDFTKDSKRLDIQSGDMSKWYMHKNKCDEVVFKRLNK